MRHMLTGRIIVIWLLAALTGAAAYFAPDAGATKYGAGSYGRCQYQSCAISLASSSSVSVDVLPANGSTRCSVASDSVTVTTSSSTGYTLTLIDADTNNTLSSGGQAIAASSGSYSSPVALVANTWGYRIDGKGGFGAGPTSAFSNGSVPSLTFAGIQQSSGSASTLVNSAVAATNGALTRIWYGVCVNNSQASGTYTDSVLYTALTN